MHSYREVHNQPLWEESKVLLGSAYGHSDSSCKLAIRESNIANCCCDGIRNALC